MNLVERIFQEKGEDREGAFLMICYAIANGSTKAKRMKVFNALMDLEEVRKKEIDNFKTGNIFCTCGNPIAPEDMNEFCDDCLKDMIK